MIGSVRTIIFMGCAAAIAVGVLTDRSSEPADPVYYSGDRPRSGDRSNSPERSAPPAYSDEFRVHRAPDGHFWVNADISGVTVPFLIDTGASSVVISPADAERLGLYLGAEDFTLTFATANGNVQAAPVTLSSVRLGQIELHDVAATVNGAPLRQSLLGMSFLGRLAGFEYRGDNLILRR